MFSQFWLSAFHQKKLANLCWLNLLSFTDKDLLYYVISQWTIFEILIRKPVDKDIGITYLWFIFENLKSSFNYAQNHLKQYSKRIQNCSMGFFQVFQTNFKLLLPFFSTSLNLFIAWYNQVKLLHPYFKTSLNL